MKQYLIILFLISILFGFYKANKTTPKKNKSISTVAIKNLKQTELKDFIGDFENVSLNSEKKTFQKKLDNSAKIKKTQIDCTSDIFFDNEIPTFNYESKFPKKRYLTPFLLDTVFRNFYAVHIKPIRNSERNYLEISKYYSPSVNIKQLKTKDNIFGFFIGLDSININEKKTCALEYAELNFPTKYYRNVKRDLFKIKKDTSLLDIGMDKVLFAKIFNKDAKTLCDTISVGNETDTSYYIFKDGKLIKVIFNFYMP